MVLLICAGLLNQYIGVKACIIALLLLRSPKITFEQQIQKRFRELWIIVHMFVELERAPVPDTRHRTPARGVPTLHVGTLGGVNVATIAGVQHSSPDASGKRQPYVLGTLGW